MPFVVELEKSWAVGMIVFQVDVVDLGLSGCVPTIFADVHLCKKKLIYIRQLHVKQRRFQVCNNIFLYLRPSLFVIILVSHPMNFQAM